MAYPFFSVIVPTFNRASIVSRAVESVLSQTYVHFELIIVNDGSSDNTKKIIMSYDDPRIHYIETDNRGVSAARNTGTMKSTGSHAAFLDSDDQWLPEKLHCDASFIRENPNYLIHQSDEFWVRSGRRVNKRNIHTKKAGTIFKESLAMCMVSPSSAVINTSFLMKTGLFDEKMPVCEDYDLWLRITAEHPVGLIDKKLIIKFGGHDDQLSRSVYAIDRFRIYSMAKLLKGGTLSDEQKTAVVEQMMKKCRIVLSGAGKHGNLQLEQGISSLITALGSGSTPVDASFLLKE